MSHQRRRQSDICEFRKGFTDKLRIFKDVNKQILIQHIKIYMFQLKTFSTVICATGMNDIVREITTYKYKCSLANVLYKKMLD